MKGGGINNKRSSMASVAAHSQLYLIVIACLQLNIIIILVIIIIISFIVRFGMELAIDVSTHSNQHMEENRYVYITHTLVLSRIHIIIVSNCPVTPLIGLCRTF